MRSRASFHTFSLTPALALGPALACALAACGSTEGNRPTGPSPRPVEVVHATPEVLRALRDEVYAHYDVRLLTEPTDPRQDPHALHDPAQQAPVSERAAREKLVEALEAAGSKTAREAAKDGLPGLVPILKGALERHERFAFLFVGEGNDASFALVELVADPALRRRDRTIELFGEKFAYELLVHDRTIIEDYPTYRARVRSPAGAPPVFRPAVTLGARIYLDRAQMERIGRESFFPRADQYRKLAAEAQDDKFFARESANPVKLLVDVKELLRWRSLEGLWSTVHALPAEDQGKKFADDYLAREEVRAATEASELARAKAAGDERPQGERLLALERRAMLSAIVHGEPLGETATAVGLAAAGLAEDEARKRTGTPPADPGRRVVLGAATSVVASLVRELAPANAPAGAADDAADFARLARATRDALRAAALAIVKRDQPAGPPPKR